MGYGFGHGGFAFAILILLASTVFLIWVSEKTGNPFCRLGKIIGYVTVALSAIMLLVKISTIILSYSGYGCPMMNKMKMGRGMRGMGMQMRMRDRMMNKQQENEED